MDRQLLLNAFLQCDSLGTLTEAVSAAFSCPVLVTDDAFHIVAAFAAADFDDEGYRGAVAHSELPLPVCEAVAERGGARIIGDAEKHRCAVGELACAGVRLGYILYMFGVGNPPSAEDCLFAERLLAKQFYADRRAGGVAETEEEILTELLDGRFASEETFRLQAAGTFLANFSPTRFALIDLADTTANHNNAHLLADLRQSYRASHPLIRNGCILLFLHEEQDISLLSGHLKAYRLRGVVSEPLAGLFAIKDAAARVQAVLRYLREKNAPPAAYACEDYMLLILLRDLDGASYSLGAVDALYRQDAAEKSALCLTLYTYICCHHSLAETCARLFTHRNTIQYRMRRIREDFGIDTDAPDGCLSLLLSLAVALVRLGEDARFIPS